MKLYLDSANIQAIEALTIYPIDGFTTNPTLCARELVDMEILIRYGIGKCAFYQVLALDTEGMLEEAKWIRSLNPDAIIKIPSTQAGFMAMRQLKQANIPVLATAIYSLLKPCWRYKRVHRMSPLTSIASLTVIKMAWMSY